MTHIRGEILRYICKRLEKFYIKYNMIESKSLNFKVLIK